MTDAKLKKRNKTVYIIDSPSMDVQQNIVQVCCDLENGGHSNRCSSGSSIIRALCIVHNPVPGHYNV